MTRPIQTKDPQVVAATSDGETYTDDIPKQDYESLSLETPAGDDATIDVGQLLFDDAGTKHGEVTKLVKHDDNGFYSSSDTWQWTVYIEYADSEDGNGGVPLGELATQLDEGATLATGPMGVTNS